MNLSSHLNPERNRILLFSSSECAKDDDDGRDPYVLESIRPIERYLVGMTCISPNGEHVIVIGGSDSGRAICYADFVQCRDQRGIVWQTPFVSRHPGEGVTCIRFSEDGTICAVVTDYGHCMFIDSVKGLNLSTFDNVDGRPIVEIAFSPSGSLIALGDTGGKITLFERVHSRRVGNTPNSGAPEASSPNGLAPAQEFDSSFVRPPVILDGHLVTVSKLYFCNDESLLSTDSLGVINSWRLDDGCFKLFNTAKTTFLDGRKDAYFVYAHYNEESHVLLGVRKTSDYSDGDVFFCDPWTGRTVQLAITSPHLSFHHRDHLAASNIFAVTGFGRTILWNTDSQKRIQDFGNRRHSCASISDDGSRICLWESDLFLTMLRRRPLGSLQASFEMPAHLPSLTSTSLSLDGTVLLIANSSGVVLSQLEINY